MKRFRLLLLASAALAIGTLTAAAQFTYFDAIDGDLHPDSANANTYSTLTDLTTGWTATSDSVALWRFRDTGPGVAAWGTSAYQGNPGDEPAIYTVASGLAPNTEYVARLYGVWTAGNNSWALEYSVNGTDWSSDIFRDTITASGVWVDNSTELGATIATPTSGDTRAYFPLPETLMSDGSGNVTLWVQPGGSDRGVYDGLALSVVPEPSTYALLGLGTLAALGFARRRRA